MDRISQLVKVQLGQGVNIKPREFFEKTIWKSTSAYAFPNYRLPVVASFRKNFREWFLSNNKYMVNGYRLNKSRRLRVHVLLHFQRYFWN